MMDMLAKILRKKFESSPVKIEIHNHSHDMHKATDLAPEVEDKNEDKHEANDGLHMLSDAGEQADPEDHEMNMLQALTKGDGDMQTNRKPTFEEQAKGKMKERMMSITKNKKKAKE